MSLNWEPPSKDDNEDFTWLRGRDGAYQPPAARPPMAHMPSTGCKLIQFLVAQTHNKSFV